jgi:hypothetical protein
LKLFCVKYIFSSCFYAVYSIALVIAMSSESEGSTPSKLKRYDLKFKLEAVEYAEKESKKAAAEKFKVNRWQIQEWIKQKAEIKTQM